MSLAHQARGLLFALVLALTAVTGRAGAAALSFTGNLAQDDSVATFGFALSGADTVTLRTFSYAGGTNGAGAAIAAGGFDPVLSLFDAQGSLLLTQDDATPGCDGVGADPVTSECFDVRLVANLAAGEYLVAISQFDNHPLGPDFAAGFGQSGASFTAIFECANGQFCDVDADSRTSFWAADVSGAAVVPAPAVGWLMGAALGLASSAFRRRAPRGARP